MATRGVNGAASGSLNERFIKCAGCKVNVPKEDMLALDQCTVCGRPYEAVVSADGRAVEISTVAFDGVGAAPTVEKKPTRKRWAELTSKRGRIYYHNTETGEDRWDKPADLDADASEDAFVPFKNDAVKKAVLREQMKVEATRAGVPMELVNATQQQLQHEDEADDPFAKMTDRGGKKQTKKVSPPPARSSSPQHKIIPPAPEEEATQTHQDAAKDGGSCTLM